MSDDQYIYPEAYQAIALAAFDRAHELNRCASAVRHEAVFGAPPNLTPEQRVQRDKILDIACKILERGRDREMDKVVSHWRTYRRMTE